MLSRFLVVAAVVLMMPVAAADAASPLVGQWHVDETNPTGMSAADSSGNGLAATSTFNFSPAAGKFAGLASNTGAINAPGFYKTPPSTANDVLTSPAHLTLLAWIKQSGDPGELKYIVGRGNDGNGCTGGSYALYNGYTTTTTPHPGLRFYIRTNVGTPGIYWSTTAASQNATIYNGQWHLVAGTFDGSMVRLYVDGVEQGTGTAVPTGAVINYSPVNQSTTSLYFDGYDVPACESGPGSSWPSPIDEIRLYDRALTATELARLAAAPDGATPPVLVPDAPAGGSKKPGSRCKKVKKKKHKKRSASAAKTHKKKKKKCGKKKRGKKKHR